MNVSSLLADATGASAAQTPEAPRNGLGDLDGDAFMTLLVEQMRAQDPTDPQSATDYVAQLATFAEVEQSVKIRDALDALGQAGALTEASSAIGRRVETPDGATGTIASVRIGSDGLVATLDDGTSVPLGPGVTLSGATSP